MALTGREFLGENLEGAFGGPQGDREPAESRLKPSWPAPATFFVATGGRGI